MLIIKIGNNEIPYEEVKSKRYKRISLRVTPEKVRLSAPDKASDKEITNFLESNKKWILENWLELREKARKTPRFYETGVNVPLLGVNYMIEIVGVTDKTISARCDEDNRIIIICVPKTLASEERQKAIRDILKKLFRLKARKVYLQKLNYWSKLMGVKFNQFRVKEQKTRWGSCSSIGNINLNWRAIMSPEPVIDYLIIHELAHLRHMNHSKEFWDFVSQFCPDYKNHRAWLRENENSLNI